MKIPTLVKLQFEAFSLIAAQHFLQVWVCCLLPHTVLSTLCSSTVWEAESPTLQTERKNYNKNNILKHMTLTQPDQKCWFNHYDHFMHYAFVVVTHLQLDTPPAQSAPSHFRALLLLQTGSESLDWIGSLVYRHPETLGHQNLAGRHRW